MTRQQIRDLALDYLDDALGAYFTSAIMNQRINLAQRELQKLLISANKQFYMTCVTTSTVVDQPNYALPSDFMQVLKLDYVASGTGANQDLQTIQRMTPGQKNMVPYKKGYPMFYYLTKNSNSIGEIILTPTPDAVYTLRLEYSYLVADLTSDSQEPDCPEEFHEYISVLVARDGYLKDGRSISPIEKKLQDLEIRLKSIANQRNSDSPRMIRQTNISADGF